MANARMIHRNVSVCEQLADCSLLARLLYSWGLAHTSDYGVLPASPRRIKAQVLPLTAETPAEIGDALEELVVAGLLVRFESDGSPFVFYPTFDKYQDIHKRSGKPRDGLPIPPTSGDFREVTGSSGECPGNRIEENRREGNGSEVAEREDAPAETAPSLLDDSLPAEDPADFAHMDACNSSFTQAFVRHFRDSKPPQQAQAYAQDCRQQLRVPGATITEEQVEKQVRSGNGPQPGKESGRFGPEAYLTRLIAESGRAIPRRLLGTEPADRSRFAEEE